MVKKKSSIFHMQARSGSLEQEAVGEHDSFLSTGAATINTTYNPVIAALIIFNQVLIKSLNKQRNVNKSHL